MLNQPQSARGMTRRHVRFLVRDGMQTVRGMDSAGTPPLAKASSMSCNLLVLFASAQAAPILNALKDTPPDINRPSILPVVIPPVQGRIRVVKPSPMNPTDLG